MLFVFIVDTSPSMASPLQNTTLTRLDLSKQFIETLLKKINSRIAQTNKTRPLSNCKCHNFNHYYPDRFVLLTTEPTHLSKNQQPMTPPPPFATYVNSKKKTYQSAGTAVDEEICASCGKRLTNYKAYMQRIKHNHADFTKRLKNVQTAKPTPDNQNNPSHNLNQALSQGLKYLSEHRSTTRTDEGFGFGRPTLDSYSNATSSAACLMLVTDGECLRQTSNSNVGLQIKFPSGNPLEKMYREPFRWDQRLFTVDVKNQYSNVHKALKAMCEVTGGGVLDDVTSFKIVGEKVNRIYDMVSPEISPGENMNETLCPPPAPSTLPTPVLVEGGGVITLQALDLNTPQKDSMKRALMICKNRKPSIPLPESHPPSRILTSLPPRSAHPNLKYFTNPSALNCPSFSAIKLLSKLETLDKLLGWRPGIKGNGRIVFVRDDYEVINCPAFEGVGLSVGGVNSSNTNEKGHYFPVGFETVSSSNEKKFLSMGYLHVPVSSSTSSSTLTILPPDPHILIPLILKAVKDENKVNKWEGPDVNLDSNENATMDQQSTKHVQLDDNWKKELRGYLFSIPTYYKSYMKRYIRPLLPRSASSLFNSVGGEDGDGEKKEDITLAANFDPNENRTCFVCGLPGHISQNCTAHLAQEKGGGFGAGRDQNESIIEMCMSSLCNIAIQKGIENNVRESNNLILRSEQEFMINSNDKTTLINITGGGVHPRSSKNNHRRTWGNYDDKLFQSSEAFELVLRELPPPPTTTTQGIGKKTALCLLYHNNEEVEEEEKEKEKEEEETDDDEEEEAELDVLNMLPPDCLLSYYESRRRWIYGGSGLTCKNIVVAGVHQANASHSMSGSKKSGGVQNMLCISGVGGSLTNARTIESSADHAPRLMYKNLPLVGIGSAGVDGSPRTSAGDDSLPRSLFDEKTGRFDDSVMARLRNERNINFGNPFEPRKSGGGLMHESGDSIVPVQWLEQRPPKSEKGIGAEAGVGVEGGLDEEIQREGVGEAFLFLKKEKVKEKEKEKEKEKGDEKKTEKRKAEQIEEVSQQNNKRAKMENFIKGETLTEADLTNKMVKPNVKLPVPWAIFWSNSNKRWYFNETKVNKSIWAWPPPP